MALRPELIEGIDVKRIGPDLGDLAVTEMLDVDGAVLPTLARPLGAGGIRHHGLNVIGKNIVQLNTERAPDNLASRPKSPRT
jgi:hypothetical protein